ncbi:zinc-binding dehydrogenase, partial [Candidatus Woesearchaeota archaeon]|nr:zinc-binding dehydrogenase [Candidatus Woesearchaeota archaeon]
KAGIKRNETVLVLAAASGVGIYAVQLAKILGARVITAASSDEKLALARKLGADETVNYAAVGIEKEVMALTGSKGVDVVAEQVGQETWAKSINCLGVGGRIVTCGATTGSEAIIDIPRLFQRHISIIGSSGGTRADLGEILGFVSEGLLKPVIHSVLPLEQAAEAHRMLEARLVLGKLLLAP